MNKPYITGYYGCSCHPFNSWTECNKAHRQKFKVGDPVRHRCRGKVGFIHRIEERYFYIVKYGDLPRDECLVHAANIEPLTGQLLINFYIRETVNV